MKDSLTKTRNESLFETWNGDLDDNLGTPARQPRLRLLYHIDLARSGSISHPEFGLESGAWQTVGRKSPLFIAPNREAVWRPLEDPTVSRAQFRVRWCEAEGCFEVAPIENTKRKISALHPGKATHRETIEVATRVEPGCCIAVDDRMLFGLEVMERYHDIEEDRMGFVGESNAVWRLREDIAEVGMFRKPVLILGQTGAGKELVASAIHKQSATPGGPFQTVNCAALPEHLVESLLFGHKKGAFTGAGAGQEGMFLAAHGGTLFLDELGEMPILIQPKLLRTLQDGLVTAVGSHKSVKVDVRLVAATNRDPEIEIAEGRLRADLYHRMSAHIVQVPSLGQRCFDIPSIFLFFLERLRADYEVLEWLWLGHKHWRATIPMSFFVSLMGCAWEGNVRQLENIAERCARRNIRGAPFQTPTLPRSAGETPRALTHPTAPAIREPHTQAPPPAPKNSSTFEHLQEVSLFFSTTPKTVAKMFDDSMLSRVWNASLEAGESADERAERFIVEGAHHLYNLLSKHDFKQARVKKELGISDWTLIRMMQRLGIPRPSDLTAEAIAQALQTSGQDVNVAAEHLRVSVHGLKKRCTALGITI